MLTREENDLLTRTGPDTPMGRLFRRYWLPAMASDELPEADGSQKRLRILGEDLIAFRDTEGRVGLLSEWCSHRRASLYFARNEECGLRCAYHGWKFDIHGNCVDIPSEPDYRNWPKKVQIQAYPCIERGGAIWVYMGPPEVQPLLPEFEWVHVPDSHRRVARRWQECNWLQGLEGGLDPVHTSVLHRYELQTDPLFGNTRSSDFMYTDEGLTFDSLEAPGGSIVVGRRNAGNGAYYWRFSRWILPCFAMAPPFGPEAFLNWNAWVPRDDENCYRWNVAAQPVRPFTDRERQSFAKGGANHVEVDPETMRPLVNRDNDYMMDREGQRQKKTFSGVYGVGLQDQAVQENQGGTLDRTREVLVAGDKFIVTCRRKLLDQLRAHADNGAAPEGLDPAHQRVRSASVVVPVDRSLADVAGSGIMESRPGQPMVSV